MHYYDTGDIVEKNTQGGLIYIHRYAESINVNGALIYPQEIINMVRNLFDISHCNLVQFNLGAKEHEKVAFIYSTSNMLPICSSKLRQRMMLELPKHKKVAKHTAELC